jgi:hypothetical protein
MGKLVLRSAKSISIIPTALPRMPTRFGVHVAKRLLSKVRGLKWRDAALSIRTEKRPRKRTASSGAVFATVNRSSRPPADVCASSV